MLFAILGWIVVGVVVGFIASKFVNLHGDDPLVGAGAALGGALAAGVLFAFLSGRGPVAWDVWGLLVSAVGAGVAVAIYHGIRSRSVSHHRPTVRRSN